LAASIKADLKARQYLINFSERWIDALTEPRISAMVPGSWLPTAVTGFRLPAVAVAVAAAAAAVQWRKTATEETKLCEALGARADWGS